MTNQILLAGLILVTVILNTIAQGLLKLGSGQNPLNLYLMGGLFAYGVSTVFYIMVLGKYNLSVAYPVIIGLTMISTAIVGAWLFKEKVDPVQWIGIGLMLSGIAAVALKSSPK
ncbi:MAG: SMR family transporter [Leptolyngbyaceae cyanobacterium bins.59]|nr:SMR family transporter [Leptolyngbyaceae cyanobacterium bins.59]